MDYPTQIANLVQKAEQSNCGTDSIIKTANITVHGFDLEVIEHNRIIETANYVLEGMGNIIHTSSIIGRFSIGTCDDTPERIAKTLQILSTEVNRRIAIDEDNEREINKFFGK